MYRVIKAFADLQDKEHVYHTGDLFPRDGLTVSADRINELATARNKRGMPLIEAIKDVPEPTEDEQPPEPIENNEAEETAIPVESEKPIPKITRKKKNAE